jgi:hypothetical protein
MRSLVIMYQEKSDEGSRGIKREYYVDPHHVTDLLLLGKCVYYVT